MTIKFDDPQVEARVHEWTSAAYDEATRREIQALVDAGAKDELMDRFYRTLEFGTGGLRGKLGAGTNRMNSYIVARATQGLANYVRAHQEKPGPLRAVIAHDSRHRSREFAETTAEVFAANGFEVFISPELRPTPYTSFALRELGAHTGVVVTASHNPKEYNGYKAYWDDGSQVVPPHDKGIIVEVDKVVSDRMVKRVRFADGVAEGSIRILGPAMDDAYLAAVFSQRQNPEAIRRHQPRIVYTPLHGVGGVLAPRALAMWGFNNVICEPEQMKPNGDFPTAASPNPEEGAALSRAIELARREKGELVLATDPDADRLGIAVLHGGECHLMTGNQVSALMASYLTEQVNASGRLAGRQLGMVSTVVTSPLVPTVVEAGGGVCPLVLTGFKWIAAVAREWEKQAGSPVFVMGTEESYGYTVGSYCRDKDGIVAACVVAEMASAAAARGRTLVDELHDLYHRFGVHCEWQRSITLPGMAGAEKIKAILSAVENNPPTVVGGRRVVRRADLKSGYIVEKDGTRKPSGLPASDVFIFDLEDGSRAICRPSGTEPKIKFYFFLCDRTVVGKGLDAVRASVANLSTAAPAFEQEFFDAIGYRK